MSRASINTFRAIIYIEFNEKLESDTIDKWMLDRCIVNCSIIELDLAEKVWDFFQAHLRSRDRFSRFING